MKVIIKSTHNNMQPLHVSLQRIRTLEQTAEEAIAHVLAYREPSFSIDQRKHLEWAEHVMVNGFDIGKNSFIITFTTILDDDTVITWQITAD